jgi:hypothetical protein
LNYEKDEDTTILGASVFGNDGIYKKIKEYFVSNKFIPSNSGIPDSKRRETAKTKLYFCKVDVTQAFDSIDQKKLLSILDDILTKVHHYDF